MDFMIEKPVTRNGNVTEDDVIALKRVLNRLGLYRPHTEIGIVGVPDAEMIAALQAFQKQNDLKPTGEIRPGDDTEKALQEAIKKHQGKYIWCTVGDDKVRPEHAELEGEERVWGAGLMPGDEPRCRCWADPVYQGPPDCREKQKTFEDIKKQLAETEAKRATIEAELQSLIDRHNELVGDLQASLGKEIASMIIGIPFERLGWLGEILQRILGNTVSDKILQDADRVAQELGKVRRDAQYKAGQLAILNATLNRMTDAYRDAETALDECMAKTQD